MCIDNQMEQYEVHMVVGLVPTYPWEKDLLEL
jgi:hypothetical protein